MTCRHDDTVRVDIRNPLDDTTETVAHLCTRCLEQLSANWGCEACEWEHVESRVLCEPTITTHTTCTRPCKEHQ